MATKVRAIHCDCGKSFQNLKDWSCHQRNSSKHKSNGKDKANEAEILSDGLKKLSIYEQQANLQVCKIDSKLWNRTVDDFSFLHSRDLSYRN
jgi:hypothetical protein